jgi:hypothetical protein
LPKNGENAKSKEITMLDTRIYFNHPTIASPHNGVNGFTAASCLLRHEPWECSAEVERIREVFQILDSSPLPRVSMPALHKYQAYLESRLCFPCEALYAETRPPVRHLIRYITVVGLLPVADQASRGLHCRVEGLPGVHELPLVEIGLREDNVNYQVIDDFAYWFLNSW